MRQKRYRYAFRKALLQAASKEPDCTGRLIQELRSASRAPARHVLGVLNASGFGEMRLQPISC